MNEYDHPILYLKNTTELATGGHKPDCIRVSSRDFIRLAHRKTRRLVKQALKGNKIRCNKRPGNSWDLY